MMPTVVEAAALGSQLTGLSTKFIAAWYISENGWTWPSTNNPGNVSYSGEGIPSTGVFAGVVSVLPNKVVVYENWEAGVKAWAEVINQPKGEGKWLTIDTTDLKAHGDDIKAMCETLGRSNWAGSHYQLTDGHGSPVPGTYPGQLVWDVYNDGKLAAEMGDAPAASQSQGPTPAAPAAPGRSIPGMVHYVQPGETLTAIDLRFHVPVAVLALYNDISDPNHIEVGQKIEIPSMYRVRPGDTVSGLAVAHHTTVDEIVRLNHINPDVIYVGQMLYI